MEEILFRTSEMSARPEAIEALQVKLTKVEDLVKKWETTHPQITEEERSEVLAKVATTKAWIEENTAEQDKKESHEEPAFSSSEVPKQAKSLQGLVKRLSKKPKPKVEKSNTTDTNSTDDTDATESSEKVDEDEKSDGDEENDEDAKSDEVEGNDEDAKSDEDSASGEEDASSEEQAEETDASEESEESPVESESGKAADEL